MAGLGWQELLIIMGILLLLFGATRLPKLAKSMGQSVRGFKKGLEEDVVEEDPTSVQEASAEPEEKKGEALLTSGDAPPSTSS